MSQHNVNDGPAERILAALKAKPDQKASELATALSVDRKEINSLLFGRLRDLCFQDSKYRWRLAADAQTTQGVGVPQFADTPLSRLCRYYLACVGYDDEGGVSVFASSNFNDSDYLELSTLPGATDSSIFQGRGFKDLSARCEKTVAV